MRALAPAVCAFSQHKFASNVMEKCLKYGGPAEIELMVEQVSGGGRGSGRALFDPWLTRVVFVCGGTGCLSIIQNGPRTRLKAQPTTI